MTSLFEQKIQDVSLFRGLIQPDECGNKTNSILENQASLYNQPQKQEPQDKRGFFKKALTKTADKIGNMKRFADSQAQYGTGYAAAASNWANKQPEQATQQQDPNSLFTNPQQQTQQPQQQTQQPQQQTQQQIPQPVQAQFQAEWNKLPPELKTAYGNNVQTYMNIKNLEQQLNPQS